MAVGNGLRSTGERALRALLVDMQRLGGEIKQLGKAWYVLSVALNLQEQPQELAEAASSPLQGMR